MVVDFALNQISWTCVASCLFFFLYFFLLRVVFNFKKYGNVAAFSLFPIQFMDKLNKIQLNRNVRDLVDTFFFF